MKSADTRRSLYDRLLLRARRVTARISHGKYGYAIAEAVRRVMVQDRCIAVDDFDETLKFSCRLNEHMGSHIFWHGSYSTDQLALLDKIIRPDMNFVDVGANHGEFTVFVAKRLRSGHVIALEPVSTIRQTLSWNIETNGLGNVTVLPIGVADAASERDIFSSDQPFTDKTHHSGLPTLFGTGQRSQRIERIKIETLDGMFSRGEIPRCDVMKLDIEGAELPALQGAAHYLAVCRPILLIELNEQTANAAGYSTLDLFRHLRNAGYRCQILHRYRPTIDLEEHNLPEWANIVCRPADA